MFNRNMNNRFNDWNKAQEDVELAREMERIEAEEVKRQQEEAKLQQKEEEAAAADGAYQETLKAEEAMRDDEQRTKEMAELYDKELKPRMDYWEDWARQQEEAERAEDTAQVQQQEDIRARAFEDPPTHPATPQPLVAGDTGFRAGDTGMERAGIFQDSTPEKVPESAFASEDNEIRSRVWDDYLDRNRDFLRNREEGNVQRLAQLSQKAQPGPTPPTQPSWPQMAAMNSPQHSVPSIGIAPPPDQLPYPYPDQLPYPDVLADMQREAQNVAPYKPKDWNTWADHIRNDRGTGPMMYKGKPVSADVAVNLDPAIDELEAPPAVARPSLGSTAVVGAKPNAATAPAPTAAPKQPVTAAQPQATVQGSGNNVGTTPNVAGGVTPLPKTTPPKPKTV